MLIYITLMAKDVEQLFVLLSVFCIFFSVKSLFKGKKSNLLRFESFKNIYFRYQSFVRYVICKYFLSVVGSFFIIFTWVSKSNF